MIPRFLVLKTYVSECIPDYRNSVIVAKNPLAARRATSYAERLRLGIAVIHGEAKVQKSLNFRCCLYVPKRRDRI